MWSLSLRIRNSKEYNCIKTNLLKYIYLLQSCNSVCWYIDSSLDNTACTATNRTKNMHFIRRTSVCLIRRICFIFSRSSPTESNFTDIIFDRRFTPQVDSSTVQNLHEETVRKEKINRVLKLNGFGFFQLRDCL